MTSPGGNRSGLSVGLRAQACPRRPWTSTLAGLLRHLNCTASLAFFAFLVAWAVPPPAVAADSPPSILIDDARVEEGDAGQTHYLAFRVRLTSPAAADATVEYEVFPGTAADGLDFVASSGRLTFIRFGANALEHLLRVPVLGDDLVEPNETIAVRLSRPTHAVLGRATAVGVILNDDGPALAISPASVVEGDDQPASLVFPVNLSAPAESPVSVAYFTANLTAEGDRDYLPQSGWVEIEPGQTRSLIEITVLGDRLYETNETLVVQLTSPLGATLLRSQALGTIIDNDRPVLTVTDASAAEGTSADGRLVFPVRLSLPSPREAQVRFRTEPRTATATADFTPHEGVLVIPPGQTTGSIPIELTADDLDEPDETLALILYDPLDATLDRLEAIGVIRDDDAPPFVTVADAQAFECEGDPPSARFAVQLSRPSGRTLQWRYSTRPGTALPGEDYLPSDGTLEVPPNTTQATIVVPILCDSRDEPEEFFDVILEDNPDAVLIRAMARGRIADANPPEITIEDARVDEPDSGIATLRFLVRLSSPTLAPVSVEYATIAGSASTDADFLPVSGALTFPPGTVLRSIDVPIPGDTLPEGDESFQIALSQPVNARLARGLASGLLIDNDQPEIVIEDRVIVEGDADRQSVLLPVRLSRSSSLPIRLVVTTRDGTAEANTDYLPTSASVEIPAGATLTEIPVEILGNLDPEPNEEFFVDLETPDHAILSRATATITIIDDDRLPVVTAADVSVPEGDSGTREAEVRFSLSRPSPGPIVIVFATASESAQPNEDYRPQGGEIRFGAGEREQIVRVGIMGDTRRESDERLLLVLRAPTNAVLARTSIPLTILDDDTVTLTIDDTAVTVSDSMAADAVLTLSLSRPASQPVTARYLSRDGTAEAGADFAAQSGQLTFPPGETLQHVVIPVFLNAADESEETFFVELSDVDGAVLARSRAAVRIVPETPPNRPPTVVLGSPEEGDSFPVEGPVRITAVASDPENAIASVELLTDGTRLASFTEPPYSFDWTGATPGSHLLSARATDAAGLVSTSAPIAIRVLPAPVLAISPLTASESDGLVPIPVVLSRPSLVPVRITAKTVPGTALAGSDFVARQDRIDFAPGETERAFLLEVLDDTSQEPPQELRLELSEPTGATVAQASIPITLLDDDPPPTILASDRQATEGDSGSVPISLPLTLSAPSELPVSVDYASVGGSALPGQDFLPTSGTLTWTPGETVALLSVPVLGDAEAEADETFDVELSRPFNAVLTVPRATVTILDDDPVTPVTNQPPIVELLRPVPRQVFASGEAIVLEAAAGDPDGRITRVDFYVGPTRIGSATTPPYEMTWEGVPLGDHVLKAVAIDDLEATGESPPVRIAATEVCGRTAILGNPSDPELEVLIEDLFVLGVGARTLSPDDASRNALAGFDLIVWIADPDRALRDADVALLRDLADDGKALYFVGDHLLTSLSGLSASARESWLGLTRILPGTDPGTEAGPVGFEGDEFDPTVQAVLLAGKAGRVDPFTYPDGFPSVRQVGDKGETVLARAGAREVLVAVEDFSDPGRGRRLTQAFRVTGGDDLEAFNQRRTLFQNAAWWLLNCQRCGNLNLVPLVSAWPETAQVGQQVTYSVQVLLSGGCEALAVRVLCQLPEGMQLVSAQSGRGDWTLSENTVNFYLGRMPRGTEANLQLTARPGMPGLQEARFIIRSLNEPEGALTDNEVPLLLDVDGPPQLVWTPASADQPPRLSVRGRPNDRFVIETAPAVQGPWSNWTEIDADEPGGTGLPLVIGAGESARFLRARRIQAGNRP